MADKYINTAKVKLNPTDTEKTVVDIHDSRLGDSFPVIQSIENPSPDKFLNQNGEWIAVEAADGDTKNTAGATNSNDEMFFIGAKVTGEYQQTYTNSNVKFQNGNLIINGHKITISDTQPTDAAAGDIWVDVSIPIPDIGPV